MNNDKTHLLECLARELLNTHSKTSGNAWLARYEKLHGTEARKELDHYLDMERNRRDAAAKKTLYG